MAKLERLPDVAMLALRRRDGAGLPRIGTSQMRAQDQVIATGPDEWLIIAVDGQSAELLERTADLGGLQVDVSGNRVAYRVSGKDAAKFLAAGCAIDFDEVQPGGAVSTLFARAQVVIVNDGSDKWRVLPRRSFARYLEDWAEAQIG